jgi:hypothetical protein
MKRFDLPRWTFAIVLACLVVPIPQAFALDGTPLFQSVGGYSSHALLNPAGNWLLDRFDDFPSASLSSLSVVATSSLVAMGTSLVVYGIGEAMEDTHGSLGYTLLGGVGAVGIGALAGAIISQDDPLTGAALGSVLGRYLAPVAATAAYALSGSDKELEIRFPVVSASF